MSIGAPVPARVDAATKQALLGLLAHAVGQGWPVVKACRVLGLDVRRYTTTDADHAVVEFVARYRVAGRAVRLHECSRFVREAGRWYYVDGDSH